MSFEVLVAQLGESMRVRLADGRVAAVMSMAFGKSRICIIDGDLSYSDNW